MCSGKRPYYLIGVRGFVGTCRLIVAALGVIRTQDNAIMKEETTDIFRQAALVSRTGSGTARIELFFTRPPI